MYRFRKWYLDCLSATNDFVLAYIADVRLGSLHLRSITVHLAEHGSGALVTRSFPILASAVEALDRNGSVGDLNKSRGAECPRPMAIESAAADCAIVLRWHNQPEFDPVIISTGRASHILWKPLALPCAVSGHVNLDGHEIELHDAPGYADYVESTCLPPLVPIHTLRWGRISEPGLGMAYIVARNRLGTRSWSRLCGRTGDSWFQSDQVQLSTSDSEPAANGAVQPASAYSLSATSSGAEATLRVHPEACVQRGSFIDQQTSRSALVRALLKRLARNPRGCKFLGHADLTVEGPGMRFEKEQIPCVDELVSF